MERDFCHICHTDSPNGLRLKETIEPLGDSGLKEFSEETTICSKCAKKIEQRARSLSEVDVKGLTTFEVFKALAKADWLGEFLLRVQRMEEMKDEWKQQKEADGLK